MNQKLVIQNLSQSTDSSDLLGGEGGVYKSFDMCIHAMPIMKHFGLLFTKTLNLKQNPYKYANDEIKRNFDSKNWAAMIGRTKIMTSLLLPSIDPDTNENINENINKNINENINKMQIQINNYSTHTAKKHNLNETFGQTQQYSPSLKKPRKAGTTTTDKKENLH
ncbi:type A von Willebrand factor domain-containing protein [Reticulomyxa filosa]|uniref:Type A von Willebrand factor domain-containing protein n=1 Tax=Reticulomyxa filosa TaxID=46433 RepID=X6LK97_RETFI|nr:type A von Willebrand factor domain-containing protein [Reticulomyxa filosa]|eukprot:ETO01150.1 type A von Willebrand factor domain-containing protein [Reticulomyxa filosa]